MKIKKSRIINIVVLIIVSVLSLAIGVTAASLDADDVSYGDTTVNAAIDELYTKANNMPVIESVTCMPGYYCTTSTSCPSGALCSKVKLGDYVSMTPTSTSYTIPMGATGYTSDQTINPSELNLWRVIDIRNDGTIEMISEYVSSKNVYFRGQKGYLNFVGTLNLIAKQYENSKYTVGSRYIGFNGQTQVIIDTSKFTNTAPWTSNTSDNSNEALGGGDFMYENDTDKTTGLVYNALGTLKAFKVGTTTTTNYWLSSRRYNYFDSTYYYWTVRNVTSSMSSTSSSNVLYKYDSGWGSNTSSFALRPIVTLRADVTTSSGSGTSASPWVLS